MTGGNLRTAREVLVAELLGDVDKLINRLETLGPELDKAAERLTTSRDALLAASSADAEAAKASVGQYITRQTNEAVTKAKAELRATMNEAARAAYEEIFAARMHELVTRIETAAKPEPPSNNVISVRLTAVAIAVATIAACVTAMVLRGVSP